MDGIRYEHVEHDDGGNVVGRTPATAQEVAAIAEHGDWYEWRCRHWHTKWDAFNGRVLADDERRLVCEFDTAWGPPTPVLRRLESGCRAPASVPSTGTRTKVPPAGRRELT